MALEKDLTIVGLSDKEAKVYVALLELNHASVQDISRKAKVNRATTYIILDALIKKGLCSTIQKDKKVFYTAETPERLGSLFAMQQQEIEEKKRILTTLMPELLSLNNAKENKPTVRFFEGKEGLKTLVYDMYSSKEKLVRSIFSVDALNAIFTKEEQAEAREKRLKANITFKTIYSSTKDDLPPMEMTERVRVDAIKFPISNDIAIYDGKIRIASSGKHLSGVILEDQEMYSTFVSIFDMIWEAAEKNSKK